MRVLGYREAKTPLLNGVHKLTHSESQCRDSSLKVPRSDLLADLGEPLKETGGSWDSLGDINAGSSHFCDLLLYADTGAGEFWNPPSRLLVLGAYIHTSMRCQQLHTIGPHSHVPTGVACCWAMKPAALASATPNSALTSSHSIGYHSQPPRGLPSIPLCQQ